MCGYEESECVSIGCVYGCKGMAMLLGKFSHILIGDKIERKGISGENYFRMKRTSFNVCHKKRSLLIVWSEVSR